jgi:hypothetical protein
MARIKSLSILASTEGNDYLAEKYGAVIENITSKNIASTIKNNDLSGNPDSGTVEAKRFVNATVNDYGTARAGGKGTKVKAKPVIVALDVDREIIEEVEEKDVALYGVEGFIERRLANHELRMGKDLERNFFNIMSGLGQVFTTSETTVIGKVEAAIVALEETQNDFVDGVDRMFMTVIAAPSIYSALQGEIDKLSNPNVNSAAAEIEVFHGCKIRKSTDLPAGVEFIVQVDSSVAQPLKVTLSPAAKIPMSNAYSFGIFYSFGTKEVSPDLIQVKTSGTLTLTSAAGTASGDTKVTVKEAQLAGTKYFVKSASSQTAPAVGTELTGYTEWDGVADITATTGHKLAVAEVNADGLVIRAGLATVTSKS